VVGKIREWAGFFDAIIGNLGAAEGGEVGAGAQCFADVFGESADIGTGAAMDANCEFRVVVV